MWADARLFCVARFSHEVAHDRTQTLGYFRRIQRLSPGHSHAQHALAFGLNSINGWPHWPTDPALPVLAPSEHPATAATVLPSAGGDGGGDGGSGDGDGILAAAPRRSERATAEHAVAGGAVGPSTDKIKNSKRLALRAMQGQLQAAQAEIQRLRAQLLAARGRTATVGKCYSA